jgi:hypothetical protein
MKHGDDGSTVGMGFGWYLFVCLDDLRLGPSNNPCRHGFWSSSTNPRLCYEGLSRSNHKRSVEVVGTHIHFVGVI